MKIQATHPDTGKTIILDMPSLTDEQIREMSRDFATERELKAKLENLPISAEGKVFLTKLLKYTINIGGTVIKFGKKLIEITVYILTKLTHLTFWTILAAILAFLISIIPGIGPVISPIISPILVIGGLSKGFYEQIKSIEPSIIDVIEEATSSFAPLKGHAL